MTPRARHLEEMRYALAHALPLEEARKRLAADKRRASEAAIANLRNQPIVPGRDRRAAPPITQEEGQTLPRWMMAD